VIQGKRPTKAAWRRDNHLREVLLLQGTKPIREKLRLQLSNTRSQAEKLALRFRHLNVFNRGKTPVGLVDQAQHPENLQSIGPVSSSEERFPRTICKGRFTDQRGSFPGEVVAVEDHGE
jgi:hypothetical protein